MTLSLQQVPAKQTALEASSRDAITFEASDGMSEESVAQLAGILTTAINDAVTIDSLSLKGLTHVVISSDFSSDVRRLLIELGCPGIVTNSSTAQAVGKTITWQRDAETVSILVFPKEVVVGYPTLSLARGIVHHELAHVHDDRLRSELFGASEHPDAMDLDAVVKTLAEILWSEYFAERIARRHYSEDDLQSFADNHEIITNCIDESSRAVADYRDHGDVLWLWQHSVSMTNVILGVIGRTIGELHSAIDTEGYWQTFQEGLGRTTSIVRVANDSAEILGVLYSKRESWESNAIQGLNTMIFDSFHILGVFPQVTANELYVDVP